MVRVLMDTVSRAMVFVTVIVTILSCLCHAAK